MVDAKLNFGIVIKRYNSDIDRKEENYLLWWVVKYVVNSVGSKCEWLKF